MGLQRYTPWDNMGVPVMDEDGTGEWVLLEDVIKLLEGILAGKENGLAYCYECGAWDYLYPDVVELIKGETK